MLLVADEEEFSILEILSPRNAFDIPVALLREQIEEILLQFIVVLELVDHDARDLPLPEAPDVLPALQHMDGAGSEVLEVHEVGQPLRFGDLGGEFVESVQEGKMGWKHFHVGGKIEKVLGRRPGFLGEGLDGSLGLALPVGTHAQTGEGEEVFPEAGQVRGHFPAGAGCMEKGGAVRQGGNAIGLGKRGAGRDGEHFPGEESEAVHRRARLFGGQFFQSPLHGRKGLFLQGQRRDMVRAEVAERE